MGFLDRLARGAEFRSGLASPADWLVDAFGGSSSSGQRISVRRALNVAPFFAGVSLISEKVGGLPFKVFRGVDGEKLEARDHRAWRMLHDQPNPSMPANRFWSTVVGHLILWGNAYLEKRRDPVTGLVNELWPVLPGEVSVEWDPARRMKTFRNNSTQPPKTWTEETMLHITAWSTDGLVGMSLIEHCRDAFGGALARDEFEGNFYRRGVRPSVVIQHPRLVGEEGAKNLRRSIEAAHGGRDNWFGAMVLEEGATFKELTMPLRDLEFIASQQLSRTDIAVMLHLPPAYLGGSTGDSLTYATIESNNIQFAQHAVEPWTTAIGKAVSADVSIFPFQSWFAEWVLEGLMRGDAKSRAEVYKALDEMDAITTNEIRAKENMPPLPGGDSTRAEREQEAAEAQAELAPEPPPMLSPANGNGNGLAQLPVSTS